MTLELAAFWRITHSQTDIDYQPAMEPSFILDQLLDPRLSEQRALFSIDLRLL